MSGAERDAAAPDDPVAASTAHRATAEPDSCAKGPWCRLSHAGRFKTPPCPPVTTADFVVGSPASFTNHS